MKSPCYTVCKGFSFSFTPWPCSFGLPSGILPVERGSGGAGIFSIDWFRTRGICAILLLLGGGGCKAGLGL